MRIGIEVCGTQSASRYRGIGRFVRDFVNSLQGAQSSHEFVLYARGDSPRDFLPDGPICFLNPDHTRGEFDMTAAFRRLLGSNPDKLDLMLVTDPLEMSKDLLTPARPLSGVKMASVMHDLIPLLFRDHYYKGWPGPEFVRRYHRGLDQIRSYDLLLAISESTRQDLMKHLGVPASKITTIMAATTPNRWRAGDPVPTPEEARTLAGLGIRGHFVYSMGAMEYRKNIWGLIDAFAQLPRTLRDLRQLVLTYAMSQDEESKVRQFASDRGIADLLLITPRIDDEVLATLYRRCDAFVFPSHYEGFGLPVLEAMHCGAPVITGNNSSLSEVVGQAGLLTDVACAQDMSQKLRSILEDPRLAASLKRTAPERAASFSWSKVATAAISAFESLDTARGKIRVDKPSRASSSKSRIAYFSPFPPMVSGISDYSERLVKELRDDFNVDIYHDSGYDPGLKIRSLDHACFDHRLFRRHDAIRPYDALVYQMGNSPLHKYIYELMETYPGVVTLHDFSLAGFRFWDAMNSGRGIEGFQREIDDFDSRLTPKDPGQIQGWMKLPGGVAEECAKRGIYLNQRIFRKASAVVVHSPWCVRQAQAIHGELGTKAEVILYGANPIRQTAEEIAATRERYGLPRDAFIVGNFGLIHSTKMNVESLIAFSHVARERKDAMFILVGPEYDDGAARATVAELGLTDRVRFFGAKPAAVFVELAGIADLGLNLRRPPTNGETSSALLDLLRQGIPTIITDVDTFTDFPEASARKVRWEKDGIDGLTREVLRLSRDHAERIRLGEAARRYVEENHSWSVATAKYRAVIERSFRFPATGTPSAAYRGPHRRSVSSVTHPGEINR